MKLETFFEKFEQFADAPNAVTKMRELVMWSAFCGAFSSEARDQPMPEEFAVVGAPTLPSIPSSWKWQRGDKVFEVIRGVSYKKNDVSDSSADGFFPVLRANNIGNKINFDDLVYVPRGNIRDEQFVRRGDILIAMSSGSKKLVGKAAPIASEFEGAFGAFCGVIRNKSEMPDEVLARYFQSPQYTSWVTAAGRGIGINNLGRGDLDSLPIPTPPLAEQYRIVAKVDELMALCDRLEAQQQERDTRHAALARASLARFAEAPTPANLDFLFHPSYTITPTDLRKSILTLAVQGKLVPQDTNDEPAKALIDRVTELREHSLAGKRAKVAKIIRKLDESESDHSIPDDWAWCRLGDLVLDFRYGTSRKCAREGSGVPVLRIPNIQSGKIDSTDLKFTDMPTSEFDELCLREGDILLVRSNGSENLVGRSAVVSAEDERFAYAGYLVRARIPGKVVYSPYLHIALSTPSVRSQIEGPIRTTSGVKNINTTELSNLVLPLPPLAEQRRIVAKVDQLMALVDQLETQITASRASAAKLMAAVVAELTS
jgi:type I restriction enzyme S subunit